MCFQTGGFEPREVNAGSSGDALAEHMRKEIADIRSFSDKPIYVWNDMFDPTMNAVQDYYHVRGTLAESWKGVDPKEVVMLVWQGPGLAENGKDSLTHFYSLGFTQMIQAFYDMDVQQNYNLWQTAIDGRSIAGSAYATWVNPPNYSKLGQFGALWWD